MVLRGSGRMKVDDEIVELKEWDAVRVPPGTWRGYEAGPEGLEILVIGAPNLGEAPREDVDGQRDWWADRSNANAAWQCSPGLAVPPVLQLDDPAAGGGAGDQVEPVGLGDAVEQPGALARNVGEQAQLELVDQVELHERAPEADAAPDHDVAVAASPELVDLFCRVTSGDGGVGPVGRLQGPGEDDLAPGVQDVGERVVGGRCHRPRRCPRRRCGP